VTCVAVLAHSGKSLGGGLGELRDVLARAGVTAPLWFEVPKSKKAPARARQALDEGADLVFVWGGDGMVQQCVGSLASTAATIAIVPAGTANLLATNLGIPKNIDQAVDIGLNGASRRLDVGVVNGERFAVMAGAGFDAMMIRDADNQMKRRLGRLAYVWTGAKNLGKSRVHATVKIDGEPWFDGVAGCLLVGNVGSLFGGVTVFEDAEPDDGWLEVGLVTAESSWQWLRALGRTAVARADSSPFVRTTRARKVTARFDQPIPYELDGGDRPPTRRLKIKLEPQAVAIRVPEERLS
jgi:YegS/Rv2252/BmrU family lipid kinase